VLRTGASSAWCFSEPVRKVPPGIEIMRLQHEAFRSRSDPTSYISAADATELPAVVR
jgi:hypothetical protein